MQTGEPLASQACRQLVEQDASLLRIAQQARPADRAERYGAEQLGVIGDAGTLAGLGPAHVEHVFAEGVLFYIGRQCCAHLARRVAQQAMCRLPAGMHADTAAVLQRRQKGVAQEGLCLRQQGVPGGGGDIGETMQGIKRHAVSLAAAQGK